MDNIKRLDALILKGTSESLNQIPPQLLRQILELVNSRVDMPKHVIASISKRMALKNKRVLINIFTILQYLGYECELSLYSQISTKEFLFKISGFLMNKEVDPQVKSKIMETVFCWQELFRPHQDLLPLFFQFYAGMLRNGFDIPHTYKSPFRPTQMKQYKKPQPQSSGINRVSSQQKNNPYQKSSPAPTVSEQKTFQQIREKLILTNEIIDNANPGDNVKQNGLLLQMVQQIKQCEKKVNKTINENPNQKIMQLALAANDDIFITYRRFKDLQRNKKPQPFLLTQLASDLHKQQQVRKTQSIIQKSSIASSKQSEKPAPKKQVANILDLDIEPQPKQKIQTKTSKKQENIFDLDFNPVQQPAKVEPVKTSGDIFDILGDSQPQVTIPQPVNQANSINLQSTQLNFPQQGGMGFDLLQQNVQPTQPVQPVNYNANFDSLLITTQNYQGMQMPSPSGYGITLNDNDFRTEADIKSYSKTNPLDKLEDLTYQFLKK